MKDIITSADEFTAYARENLELDARDELYVKNRILEILSDCEGDEPTADERDKIFGELSLLPPTVNEKFQSFLTDLGFEI